MKTGLRLQEYINLLQERRKSEIKRKDHLYEQGDTFTSPSGSTTTEEIRLFNEYKEQANMFRVTEAKPENKKQFILKRFFKMKRNQQVEIYSEVGGDVKHTLGKVSAVGRDFVMITNLKDRIWIPYHSISSANIPSGIPTYSNSHQSFIYDNNLRKKLLTNFGQTVSKRDALIQQFYEESLLTNLRSWSGTWVKVQTANDTIFGKMHGIQNKSLELSLIKGKKDIEIDTIAWVQSLRCLSFLSLLSKKMVR